MCGVQRIFPYLLFLLHNSSLRTVCLPPVRLWQCQPDHDARPQDFFETGVLPADTDFRLLSSKYGMGSLPGLDMASLLDSGAYHMQQDLPERIRPGTLQVMSAV